MSRRRAARGKDRFCRKYVRQKFLLNSTRYEDRVLDVHARSDGPSGLQEFGIPWNLLDQLAPAFIREVTIRRLDLLIDTEEDWETFLADAGCLDLLVIDIAGGVETGNPILRDYGLATVKAYAARLADAGVNYVIVA